MREIEFRLFSKERNKMIFSNKGWFYKAFVSEKGVLQHIRIDVALENPDRVIVMQYTGLKDKDGKKIFEGDIIFHEKFEEHSEIAYFERGMCFIGLPVEKEVREDYLKGHVHYLDLTCENLQISKCKVVGNIYENPELLEESK